MEVVRHPCLLFRDVLVLNALDVAHPLFVSPKEDLPVFESLSNHAINKANSCVELSIALNDHRLCLLYEDSFVERFVFQLLRLLLILLQLDTVSQMVWVITPVFDYATHVSLELLDGICDSFPLTLLHRRHFDGCFH